MKARRVTIGNEVLTKARIKEARAKARESNKRERLTDARAPGLRVNAYPSGQVTFSVAYRLPGIATMPNVKFGEWPDMSIAEARDLAEVIRELGTMGVDVQEGLHTRLAEELKRDRLNWRLALSPPAPPREPMLPASTPEKPQGE